MLVVIPLIVRIIVINIINYYDLSFLMSTIIGTIISLWGIASLEYIDFFIIFKQ